MIHVLFIFQICDRQHAFSDLSCFTNVMKLANRQFSNISTVIFDKKR